jgi:polar amino acid transport system substrate-binding protein
MKKVAMSLFVAAGLIAAACGGDDNGTSGGTSAPGGGDCGSPPVKSAGTFTVGAEFPYYEPFLIGNQPNPSGFEGEMINDIAQNLGLGTVKWVNIAFDQLYAPGAKQFDVGVSEITITEEREQAVDFSEPYFDANQGILVRADSQYATATTTEDLLDAQFGAEAGTTGLDYLENQVKPSKQVNQFDTTDVTSQALKAGTIDVQVIDVPIAAGIVEQSTDVELRLIGQFITNEQYGLAMEDGSALKPCVDQAITALKDDGTLDSLQEKYFPGTTEIPVFEPTA